MRIVSYSMLGFALLPAGGNGFPGLKIDYFGSGLVFLSPSDICEDII